MTKISMINAESIKFLVEINTWLKVKGNNKILKSLKDFVHVHCKFTKL